MSRADLVDQLRAFLQDRIAEDARAVKTLQDVIDVASRVRLLQFHRPVDVEIVAVVDADGNNDRAAGLLRFDANHAGAKAARILCAHHDDAEEWPCAAVRSLAHHYRRWKPADTPDDKTGGALR